MSFEVVRYAKSVHHNQREQLFLYVAISAKISIYHVERRRFCFEFCEGLYYWVGFASLCLHVTQLFNVELFFLTKIK